MPHGSDKAPCPILCFALTLYPTLSTLLHVRLASWIPFRGHVNTARDVVLSQRGHAEEHLAVEPGRPRPWIRQRGAGSDEAQLLRGKKLREPQTLGAWPVVLGGAREQIGAEGAKQVAEVKTNAE